MSAGQRSVRVAQVNKIAELEVTCSVQQREIKRLTEERDEAIKQLAYKERQLKLAASDMDIFNRCYDPENKYTACPMNPCDGLCGENWRKQWEEMAK